MAVDSEVLADTRDIVYVICTLIQTIVGLLIGYFWDKRKRKKDRLRDERQRKEDRLRAEEKSDADKLALVLGQKFEEEERIFDRFDKKVVKLGETKITDTISEHDILVYMCHPDNEKTFATTTQSQGIKAVMSDVNSIMQLFVNLCLALSSSIYNKRTCPEDIKKEFSSKIDKMGRAIYPFVSATRRTIIDDVLVYFDKPRNPGHSEMEVDEIPYIKCFQYKDGNMDCNIPCLYPNLVNLEQHVRQGKSQIIDQKDEIQRNIRIVLGAHQVPVQQTASSEIQEHIQEQQTASSNPIDLLHLIRIVMLKIHKKELNNDNINDFIEYVRGVDCYPVAEDVTLRNSKRARDDIEGYINRLKNDHQVILGYPQTAEFLQKTAEEIRKFIEDQLPRT